MFRNVHFRFEIDSGNAAVVDAPRANVALLLEKMARAIALNEGDIDGGTIRDENGNPIGEWELTAEPEEGEGD